MNEIFVTDASRFSRCLSVGAQFAAGASEQPFMSSIMTIVKSTLSKLKGQPAILASINLEMSISLKEGLLHHGYIQQTELGYVWREAACATVKPFNKLQAPYSFWVRDLAKLDRVEGECLNVEAQDLINRVHKLSGERALQLLVSIYPAHCHWNQARFVKDGLTLKALIKAEQTLPYPSRFPIALDVKHAALALVVDAIRPVIKANPNLGINAPANIPSL